MTTADVEGYEPSDEELDQAEDAEWYWLLDEARSAVKARWEELAPSGAPLPGDVAGETARVLAEGETDLEPYSYDDDGCVDGVAAAFKLDPLTLPLFARALARAQMQRRPRFFDEHVKCTRRSALLIIRARPRERRPRRVARTTTAARGDPDDPEPARGRRPRLAEFSRGAG